MIIYLDRKFSVVGKESATMAKVIPGNGEPPYFIRVYEHPNGASKKSKPETKTGG
jgi:hypothetical protein